MVWNFCTYQELNWNGQNRLSDKQTHVVTMYCIINKILPDIQFLDVIKNMYRNKINTLQRFSFSVQLWSMRRTSTGGWVICWNLQIFVRSFNLQRLKIALQPSVVKTVSLRWTPESFLLSFTCLVILRGSMSELRYHLYVNMLLQWIEKFSLPRKRKKM